MATRGARRTIAAALLAATVVAGCARAGEELPSTPLTRHEVRGAGTLAVDANGGFWVGGADGAVALDSAGAVRILVPMGGGEPPELVGSAADALLFRAGDSLVAVAPRSGERTGARDGFGAVPALRDRLGRFVVQGARSGAVLAFDPVSLDPLWGWASLDAPTTALAAAPEGDVLWQAIRRDGDGVLLARDVQTGRTLAEMPLQEPAQALLATADGDLIGALGEGERVMLARLQVRAGEMERVWSTAARLEGARPLALRYSPSRGWIAVYRPGSESGLRVLDAEAGEEIGSLTVTPLDAAFTAEGELYLLYPREIRVVGRRRR